MLRPAFAAMLGAAFGALAFPGVRGRMVVPEQWADLAALGWTVGFAGFLAILLMACREPPRRCGHQPQVSGDAARPKPPTAGSGVQPPRDAAGRFTKER